MTTSQLVLGLLTTLAAVHAKESFVKRIPNGDKVAGVDALGHSNPAGDGPLNKFGHDFESAGSQWTKGLCQADSDGDGQTNGQELGDPCCEWTTSSKVLRYTTGLSHPGDGGKKADAALWSNLTCNITTGAAPSTATPLVLSISLVGLVSIVLIAMGIA